MSDSNSISGTQSSSSTSPVSSASSSGAPLAEGGGGSTVNSSTTLSSVEDLKRKAPELWQKMLEGIGMNICNEMRQHEERLKKIQRDYDNLS